MHVYIKKYTTWESIAPVRLKFVTRKYEDMMANIDIAVVIILNCLNFFSPLYIPSRRDVTGDSRIIGDAISIYCMYSGRICFFSINRVLIIIKEIVPITSKELKKTPFTFSLSFELYIVVYLDADVDIPKSENITSRANVAVM